MSTSYNENYQEGTYSCDRKWWFKLLNHWLLPFNWHEPMPWPKDKQYDKGDGDFIAWLKWTLRNPLHNPAHFLLGITPRGKRYEWLSPTQDGWKRKRGIPVRVWGLDFVTKHGWVKGKKSRPGYYFNLFGEPAFFGWRERGNFSIDLGAVGNPALAALIATIAWMFWPA